MARSVDQLANAYARGIVVNEGFARELAGIADALRCDGHHACAEGLLRISRHHRIRGLEGRGNLVALRDRDGRAMDTFPGAATERPPSG